MVTENWVPWIHLAIGFAFGLTAAAYTRLEFRRNLRLHLDATREVLVLMQAAGINQVPIRGVLDSFDSIRKGCL